MTNLPDEQKPPASLQGPSISILKEREIAPPTKERVPVVEVGKIPETEAEKEGYVERVEKEVELQRPVTDDQGQVLVTSPAAQQPRIVLPLDQDSYLNPKNWHKPVTEAVRWLLVWTKRIIKMYPGRTVFKE